MYSLYRDEKNGRAIINLTLFAEALHVRLCCHILKLKCKYVFRHLDTYSFY